MFGSRFGKGRAILDEWSTLIADAASQEERVFTEIRELLVSREVPALRSDHLKVTELSEKLLGERRRFLVVRLPKPSVVKTAPIYVAVRPYGKELQLSWYMTEDVSFLRRVLRFLLALNPFKRAIVGGIFENQDLSAYGGEVHACVKQVMSSLMTELGQDSSKVDTRSRGILGLW